MTKTENNGEPDQSKKKLILAVTLAAVAASLIAVFQILPAQFGIDLTGYGEYTGLMKRYETQQYYKRLRNTTENQERVDIEVLAGKDLEYKLYMLEGDQVKYRWATDAGKIFFEFHGEPKGLHSVRYESYDSDTASESYGTFTASFEGTHGWYWRNDSEAPVVIALETHGNYSNVGVKAAAFSR